MTHSISSKTSTTSPFYDFGTGPSGISTPRKADPKDSGSKIPAATSLLPDSALETPDKLNSSPGRLGWRNVERGKDGSLKLAKGPTFPHIEKVIYIWRVFFSSGDSKDYVGKTKRFLDKRLTEHLRYARCGCGSSACHCGKKRTLFHQTLRSYAEHDRYIRDVKVGVIQQIAPKVSLTKAEQVTLEAKKSLKTNGLNSINANKNLKERLKSDTKAKIPLAITISDGKIVVKRLKDKK